MRVGNQHGSGCGTCIKVCPWNKPYTPLHRFVNWSLRNIPLTRNIAVKADDLFGYGKPRPEEKWWFDWEVVDEEFRAPTSKTKKQGSQS